MPDQDLSDQDGEVRAGGDIIFRVDDGAAIVQLNRPAKRNALSQAMWEAISAALAEAAARPDVRVFVFTGLPGVFCAGADLTALKSADREAAARYREVSLRGYDAVRDFSLPTIAVIDGLCIGGGNNLALACDIRLASPRASFAIPAVRHGIVYDRPTVTRLVELMGSGRASHLLFTAGRIDAARAAETGLVDILTEDLDAELASFLDALRAADMPTLLAIRDTIRKVRLARPRYEWNGAPVTDVTTSDGVRLYAEATGSGLPVLFIHEFAADHRTWSQQVDALSGRFRCVTYAARGYPPSEVPPEPERYNYLQQADDAIDVLDAFGIARAHVVGLSMGGFCALQLGIRYPGRVSSLLVASAGSGASPRGRAAFLAETEQMAAAFRAEGMAAVSARQAMGPNRIQLRRKNRQAWEEFAGQLAEHSAEGMALTVLGIQRSRPSLYDITDQLAGITAPTLVVNGDEDEACLEPGLLLKRVIPRAGLAIVPNSGHVLNLEEPGLFNDMVRMLVSAAEAGTWPARDPRSRSESMGIADAETEA